MEQTRKIAGMPISASERREYQAFTAGIIERLGSVNFDPNMTVWHYTHGAGLLGIFQSGQIFATQVACLNDSSETLYAQRLYKAALSEAGKRYVDDPVVTALFDHFAEEFKDDSTTAASSPSKFFVACFTAKKDDLSQWRAYSEIGGENGYAVGFRVGGLFGLTNNRLVVRVNYDSVLHSTAANDVAEATIHFYLKGLRDDPSRTPKEWAEEFFAEWDEHIYRLSPMIKDCGFKDEEEIRIVHELYLNEMSQVQIRQKRSLLARYIALSFAPQSWVGKPGPKLPVLGIVIGPSRHPAVSRVSVGTLLLQLGYENVPIEISSCPLQSP
jgi:hypothetical protein